MVGSTRYLLVFIFVAAACGDSDGDPDSGFIDVDVRAMMDATSVDASSRDAGNEDVPLFDAAQPVDAGGDAGGSDAGGADSGTSLACGVGGSSPYSPMSGVIDVASARNVDIAVGCDGVVHAVYRAVRDAAPVLIVVHLDGDVWVEDAQINRPATFSPSIRVGIDERVHILFSEPQDGGTGLTYAVSPAFEPEPVDFVDGLSFGEFHLEIGSDSVPHIAYTYRRTLHYVSKESGAWVTEVVISGVSDDVALALRGSTPTIVFDAGSEQRVGVFSRISARNWTEEGTTDAPNADAFSAQWSGDTLRLAWVTNRASNYTLWTGAWRDGVLDERIEVELNFAFDINDIDEFQLVADPVMGAPHIADWSGRGLQYHSVRGGRVVTRPLGTGFYETARIAVDRFGSVHIVYEDDGTIRYRRLAY